MKWIKKFSLRTCIPLSSMQVSLYDTYVCKSPLPLVDTYLKLQRTNEENYVTTKIAYRNKIVESLSLY